MAMGVAIWRWVSPNGDECRRGDDIAVIKISPRRRLRHAATALAVWRRPSPRLCNRPVISAGLSRFGDPRRRSAICVAILRQLSPFRDSCRAMARHLVVQCKLSRPISPFRDRRGTAILAATAVAKVVQQAQCRVFEVQ